MSVNWKYQFQFQFMCIEWLLSTNIYRTTRTTTTKTNESSMNLQNYTKVNWETTNYLTNATSLIETSCLTTLLLMRMNKFTTKAVKEHEMFTIVTINRSTATKLCALLYDKIESFAGAIV